MKAKSTTFVLAGSVAVAFSQISEAAPLCVLNGGLTVLDDGADKMWYQTPPSAGASWANANTAANSSTLAGYTDWGLPSVQEYQSLGPQLASPPFGSYALNQPYWTDTTGIQYTLPNGPSSTQQANSNRPYWPVRDDSTNVCPSAIGCSGQGYTTRLTDATTPTISGPLAATGSSRQRRHQVGRNGTRITAERPAPRSTRSG